MRRASIRIFLLTQAGNAPLGGGRDGGEQTGLIQVKEEGWTGFSEGWQGCSEGFPEGEARGKSLLGSACWVVGLLHIHNNSSVKV